MHSPNKWRWNAAFDEYFTASFIFPDLFLYLVPSCSAVVAAALTKCCFTASVPNRLTSSKHHAAFYGGISQTTGSPFMSHKQPAISETAQSLFLMFPLPLTHVGASESITFIITFNPIQKHCEETSKRTKWGLKLDLTGPKNTIDKNSNRQRLKRGQSKWDTWILDLYTRMKAITVQGNWGRQILQEINRSSAAR